MTWRRMNKQLPEHPPHSLRTFHDPWNRLHGASFTLDTRLEIEWVADNGAVGRNDVCNNVAR
jgi:hypothetical protein